MCHIIYRDLFVDLLTIHACLNKSNLFQTMANCDASLFTKPRIYSDIQVGKFELIGNLNSKEEENEVM